jgi:prepilin-type N-terminal cleavage/methylation domain-containing protein
MIIKNKQKSFTLIELLVVIVIIGILAGVIMISTSSSIDKANIAKIKVFEESVQNNLAANMVSAWDADHVTKTEAGNWTLNDKWGSNNGTFYDGTVTTCSSSACPQIVNDKQMGSVLSFDGVNDYIQLVDSQEIRMTRGGTITAWIYPKTCGGGPYARVIDKSTNTSCANGYMIWIESTNIKFQTSGSTQLVSLSNSLKFNEWQFITVAFNSSGRKIYKNGVNVTASGGAETMLPPNISGVVAIGNRANAIDRTFDGFIGGIKIYDIALSSSQIKQNYIAGLNSLLANGNISKEDYNERINNLAYEQE